MIGEMVSHYKILEKLGEGGMGVVYKANDTKLNRPVALKFLPSNLTCDKDSKEKFIDEAQTASALDHQSICTIYEIDESHDGQLFISMAYCGNQTLKSIIASKPLTIEKTVDIAILLAQGLVKAHQNGIIHRDIKPANILIQEDDSVKIIDFGLSKLMSDDTLSNTATTKGTVAYMSPEQALGKPVDQRTDIWSFGVVLYQMLTGKIPFAGDNAQVILYSIVNEKAEAISDSHQNIPTELERIVEKAMQKDAGKRYRDMAELLEELELTRDKIEAGNVKFRIGILRTRRRRRIALISLIISLLISFTAIGYYYQIFNKSPAPVSIAVAGFENMTGDSTYNNLRKILPYLFITSLEQSSSLQVTTWERLQDLLKQSGKYPVEIIDNQTGLALCQQAGIDFMVTGSFTIAGDLFVTDAKVLDVKTRKLIKSARSKGIGKQSILNSQIDEISSAIVLGLEMPKKHDNKYQKRIVDVATSSIEAYKYYIRGNDEVLRKNWVEAVSLFQKALAIDSTFAMAYHDMNLPLRRSGRGRPEGIDALKKAKRYAAKATEKERMFIEATFARLVEANNEKWGSILQQMAQKFPNEKEVHSSLGIYYGSIGLGNSVKAIEEYENVLRLDPFHVNTLSRICYEYLNTQDYENALKFIKQYLKSLPNSADPIDTLGELYFRLGNLDQAIKNYEKAMEMDDDWTNPLFWYCFALKEDYGNAMFWIKKQIPIAQDVSFFWGGFYYAWLGNTDRAFSEFNNIQKESSGDHQWVSWLKGWIYYDYRKYDLSRIAFEDAYSKWKRIYRELNSAQLAHYNFELGLLDIAQDKIDLAKSRLDSIGRLLSEFRGIRKKSFKYRYNNLHAEILLAEGNSKKAISILQKDISQVITNAGFGNQFRYTVPFKKDVLARAYIQNGDTEKAIAEYKRLTTFNPEDKDRYLIHPTYYYALGKLYEDQGQNLKAKSRYLKFLELWKNADEELPEMLDVKTRLSHLRN